MSRGVTTVVVGTRGRHRYPLAAWFDSLRAAPYAVNVASFAGLGTLRGTAGEAAPVTRHPGRADIDSLEERNPVLGHLRTLLRAELEAGALGLSVGPEVDLREGPAAHIVAALRPDVEAAGGTVIVADAGDEAGAVGWNALPASLARATLEREGRSLEAAVHRVTEAAAVELGIRGSSGGPRAGRGVIELLAYADLVLLDPERIPRSDEVARDAGSLPGVVRVWVSGQEVYVRGRVTEARPGRVIRWPRM